MKLPKNVKIKSGILAIIPWVSNHTAQAIYPNIYLPRKVYINLEKSKPNSEYIAILAHEQTHIERQKKTGFIKWLIKYIFLPKFRFNEELVAIKVQIKCLKKYKKEFDIEKKAESLSGWLYLWPASYKTAKRELEKI